MIIPTSMSETLSSFTPAHELGDTELEPHPATDKDLELAVETIQSLWDDFQDARIAKADEQMAALLHALSEAYDTLEQLLHGPLVASAETVTLARDELWYAENLLDKMHARPNRTPRPYPRGTLGDNHHFVL